MWNNMSQHYNWARQVMQKLNLRSSETDRSTVTVGSQDLNHTWHGAEYPELVKIAEEAILESQDLNQVGSTTAYLRDMSARMHGMGHSMASTSYFINQGERVTPVRSSPGFRLDLSPHTKITDYGVLGNLPVGTSTATLRIEATPLIQPEYQPVLCAEEDQICPDCGYCRICLTQHPIVGERCISHWWPV